MPISLPKPHRAPLLVAMLVLLLVTAVLAYRVSQNLGFGQMRDEASHQLDVLAAAIDSEVTRHAAIPSAVELNPDVLALLRNPGERQDVLQASANHFLQSSTTTSAGRPFSWSIPPAGWSPPATGSSPTTCSAPTFPTCR